MNSIKTFLIIVGVCALNYILFTREIFGFFVGSFAIGFELMLLGLYVFIRSEKMIVVFRDFFSNYPFLRYVGEKGFTSRGSIIKAFGVFLILMGLFIFIFAPTKRSPLKEVGSYSEVGR